MKQNIWAARIAGTAYTLVALGMLFAQEQPPQQKSPDGGIFDQSQLVLDEPMTQKGVEPLAKGVVHEAFATPTVGTTQLGLVVSTKPPEPIEELPPDQKPEGDEVEWISGYFAYNDDSKSYYWVSGIWRNTPPGMDWVPGTWNQVDGGWQYSPGFWRPETQQGSLDIVPAPPEPLVTADPPPPDDNSTFVPGSWVYRETRYVWRPAYWIPCRPGWVWCPARYIRTHCGYIYQDGYADYELRTRGLLFAPVAIDPICYQQVGFVYRPTVVVHDYGLMSCLFVHRHTGCYYFGDYYGAHYGPSYTCWTNYRVHRHYPCPLYRHYQYAYRSTPHWETNLVALQTNRFQNVAVRPPATFALQVNLFKSANVNPAIKTANFQQQMLLAPVNKVNNKVVPLQVLTSNQLKDQVKAIQNQKQVAVLRSQTETNILKTTTFNSGNTKINNPTTNAIPKVVLPTTKIATNTNTSNPSNTTNITKTPNVNVSKNPYVNLLSNIANNNNNKPAVTNNPPKNTGIVNPNQTGNNNNKPPVILNNPPKTTTGNNNPPVTNNNNNKPPVILNNPPKNTTTNPPPKTTNPPPIFNQPKTPVTNNPPPRTTTNPPPKTTNPPPKKR